MALYTFGTTRTDLSLEPGWQQILGDATALKPVSGSLNRSSVATAEHFYAEGSIVSGTQKVGWQFGTVATTTAPAPTLLGSGTAGAFNGYYLIPTSATTLRVQRKIAGTSFNVLSSITVPAVASTTFYFEVVVGASNTINVYDSTGTLLSGGTATDSTSGRPTSGYNGLYLLSSASSTANNGTNFNANMQLAGGGGGGSAASGLLLMGAGS